MEHFDVIIVGGGIAGASLGAELAGHRKVALIEAEAHCAMHSTGRSAAFWLESYGGPLVAPLTSASRAFLERPPPDFAENGFLRQRGALHLSQAEWPAVPDGVETRRITRDELERRLPGIRPQWRYALLEPGCADIDVAALHAAYLRRFRQKGGTLATDARLERAMRTNGRWRVTLADGATLEAPMLVDAAGAWADDVAHRSGVAPIGVAPKRRTMVQLAVGRGGLKAMPLVDDYEGTFYFKGEGDRSIWLSPHDEIATDPCDAAPEEIDIAVAIDRFQAVVDWPVERVERSWAGLRSFAPDRIPVIGFDSRELGFFWFAGQGGFGIQTAPAAAKLAAHLLLDDPADPMIGQIDARTFSPGRLDR